MNATVTLFAFAALSAAATFAHGDILAYDSTKDALVTSPGGMEYTGNAYQTPLMQIWDERQNSVLASAVAVDAVGDGVYETSAGLDGYVLPAGTAYSSQYLNFNPSTRSTLVTTVTFDAPILGVIVTGPDLLASDGLALAGVPTSNLPTTDFKNRGLEFRDTASGPNYDAFSILGNSLTLSLNAGNPGDQIRVITRANPAPEPSALAALGLGTLGLLRRRRR